MAEPLIVGALRAFSRVLAVGASTLGGSGARIVTNTGAERPRGRCCASLACAVIAFGQRDAQIKRPRAVSAGHRLPEAAIVVKNLDGGAGRRGARDVRQGRGES